MKWLLTVLLLCPVSAPAVAQCRSHTSVSDQPTPQATYNIHGAPQCFVFRGMLLRTRTLCRGVQPTTEVQLLLVDCQKGLVCLSDKGRPSDCSYAYGDWDIPANGTVGGAVYKRVCLLGSPQLDTTCAEEAASWARLVAALAADKAKILHDKKKAEEDKKKAEEAEAAEAAERTLVREYFGRCHGEVHVFADMQQCQTFCMRGDVGCMPSNCYRAAVPPADAPNRPDCGKMRVPVTTPAVTPSSIVAFDAIMGLDTAAETVMVQGRVGITKTGAAVGVLAEAVAGDGTRGGLGVFARYYRQAWASIHMKYRNGIEYGGSVGLSIWGVGLNMVRDIPHIELLIMLPFGELH